MPFTDMYRKQVEPLVQTLPQVAEEKYFALKGGTAINLLVRDMPRLSVDIDLTYLPIADREHSLQEIEAAPKRIEDRIKKLQPRYKITESTWVRCACRIANSDTGRLSQLFSGWMCRFSAKRKKGQAFHDLPFFIGFNGFRARRYSPPVAPSGLA